jgi:DNA-binding CsgD family transcriptional regulator
VDLGTAQRTRRADRLAARRPLSDGLELATRCGAVRLAERARAELIAAGARPRREHRTGRESLTPSELRVVTLAAEGQSTRDIAQALFVTTKTVDAHLGRAYRKLGINSRRELAGALDPAG